MQPLLYTVVCFFFVYSSLLGGVVLCVCIHIVFVSLTRVSRVTVVVSSVGSRRCTAQVLHGLDLSDSYFRVHRPCLDGLDLSLSLARSIARALSLDSLCRSSARTRKERGFLRNDIAIAGAVGVPGSAARFA